jgi:hypothetical protein
MKTALLFILMLCIGLGSASAQVFSIKEGIPSKTESKPVKIVGIFGESLIAISKRDRDYYIVKYDIDSLKPREYKLLNLIYQGNKLHYSDFIEIQGKYYIFSFFNNRKAKKSFFLYQELNIETLKLVDKAKIWSDSYRPYSIENTGFLLNEVSADGSKKLILNSSDNKSKEKNYVFINVYNNHSTEHWQKKLKLPIDLKYFWIKDSGISNDGLVYILGKNYFDGVHDTKLGEINFEYLLFTYNVETEELEKYKFEVGDKQVLNMRLGLYADQQIICASISYSPSDSLHYFVETYTLNDSLQLFQIEQRRNIAIYRYSGTEEKGKYRFIPTIESKKMLRISEGNELVYSIEQRYIYASPFGSSYAYMQNETFIIDSDGQIIKDYMIKKRQALSDGDRSYQPSIIDYYDAVFTSPFSYIIFTQQNSLYFIYNESIKNKGRKKWNKIFTGGEDEAYPILYYANKQDGLRLYPISDNEEDELMLYLNTYYKVENTVYIFAWQNKSQVLLKFLLGE